MKDNYREKPIFTTGSEDSDDTDLEEKPEELRTMMENIFTGEEMQQQYGTKDTEYYDAEFENLFRNATYFPDYREVMGLNISYEEKIDLFEKITVLKNLDMNSMEFMYLKKQVNRLFKKYKGYNLSQEEMDKYSLIKNQIEKGSFHIEKPTEYQILDLNMDIPAKRFIYQRHKQLLELDPGSSIAQKLKQWVDTAVSLPTQPKGVVSYNDSNYKINRFLCNIKNTLDKHVYGLEETKEKILSLVNNRITNKQAKGLSFGLVGPPGTAKTSIMRTVSSATGLPFAQINLAGCKDSSYLLGHNYTYEGSKCGAIAQAIIDMGCTDGIIFFDELDKISTTAHGIDITRALLHITDFTQNSHFHDHYLGENIPIDLSNVWFVFSMNDASLVDKILLDRFPLVHIDGYTKPEKIHICKHYLIPCELGDIHLRDVYFDDEAIEYIVQTSPDKSGVRDIKFLIKAILSKINLLKTIHTRTSRFRRLKLSFSVDYFKLPFTVTKKVIDDLKVIPKKKTENFSFMYS